MAKLTESTVEQATLEWLSELGYTSLTDRDSRLVILKAKTGEHPQVKKNCISRDLSASLAPNTNLSKWDAPVFFNLMGVVINSRSHITFETRAILADPRS
jgi:hypothetical protein